MDIFIRMHYFARGLKSQPVFCILTQFDNPKSAKPRNRLGYARRLFAESETMGWKPI